jgi:hypothetical protein
MGGSRHEVIAIISLETPRKTKKKLKLFSLWTEIRIKDVPNKKQERYALHRDDWLRMFFYTGSTTPVDPGLFFQFHDHFYRLWRVISSSQGLYLNTGQHKHIHTPNIHALSGIRTHDPSVRASEDNSCLRPRGYCDRRLRMLATVNEREA